MMPYINKGKLEDNSIRPLIIGQEDNITKDAFQSASKLLLSDELDFIRHTIYNKYFDLGCTSLKEDAVIKKLAANVPVYLVTNGMNCDTMNDKSFDPVKIPSDTIYSYCNETDLDKFKKDIEECGSYKVPKDKEKLEIIKLLGLYHHIKKLNKEDIKGKDLSFIKNNRCIFLWVDNIDDTAKQYNCSYESLFVFVLCHEFMHALMDVYDETLYAVGIDEDDKGAFRQFKEESLANGLALYLFDKCDLKSEKDKIDAFVDSQYIPYKLGKFYQERYIADLELREWLSIKNGELKIDKTFIDDWYKNIADAI